MKQKKKGLKPERIKIFSRAKPTKEFEESPDTSPGEDR
jgi:hypothetical protein